MRVNDRVELECRSLASPALTGHMVFECRPGAISKG